MYLLLLASSFAHGIALCLLGRLGRPLRFLLSTGGLLLSCLLHLQVSHGPRQHSDSWLITPSSNMVMTLTCWTSKHTACTSPSTLHLLGQLLLLLVLLQVRLRRRLWGLVLSSGCLQQHSRCVYKRPGAGCMPAQEGPCCQRPQVGRGRASWSTWLGLPAGLRRSGTGVAAAAPPLVVAGGVPAGELAAVSFSTCACRYHALVATALLSTGLLDSDSPHDCALCPSCCTCT
jgi:hypothetical protein